MSAASWSSAGSSDALSRGDTPMSFPSSASAAASCPLLSPVTEFAEVDCFKDEPFCLREASSEVVESLEMRESDEPRADRCDVT